MIKTATRQLAATACMMLAIGIAFESTAQANPFTKTIEANRDRQRGLWFGGGYARTSFQNSVFHENIGKGIIKPDFGFNLRLSYRRYPLVYDFSFYGSYFKIDPNYLRLPSDVDLKNVGGESSLALALLPNSKYFVPTLGLGFQSSTLNAGSSDSDSSFKPISINTSGFVWKYGLLINISRAIGLSLNYSHSLPKSVRFENGGVMFGYKDKALQHITFDLIFAPMFSNEL
jgi:hypothetical protein